MSEAAPVRLVCPSGREILCVKPDRLTLGILGLSVKLTGLGRPPNEISDAELKVLTAAMGVVLGLACVSPRISPQPNGPDEIGPKELGLGDAIFIVRWAIRSEQQQTTEQRTRSKCGAKPGITRERRGRKGHR